ncbi:MAG: hypothetical protein PHT94_02000 [Candidatus Nanoarchaeia archaeon]|nr:hypothetical protein [Candidatus Nanoarchaeia archaeon]
MDEKEKQRKLQAMLYDLERCENEGLKKIIQKEYDYLLNDGYKDSIGEEEMLDAFDEAQDNHKKSLDD